MARPVGLYLLNVKVTDYFYDKEGVKQLEALRLRREAGKELNCTGGECFKLSFILITVVTLSWDSGFSGFAFEDKGSSIRVTFTRSSERIKRPRKL